MKKLMLVDVNDYTLSLLKVIPHEHIECFLDKNQAGKVIADKRVYANINSDDIPKISEYFQIVVCSQSEQNLRGYAQALRELQLPFIFAAELLLRYEVTDLDFFPYPIKYLLNTYGRDKLEPLSEEEEKQLYELDEKYEKILVGVIHPTAIGAFCWTYGRFCEYAETQKNAKTLIGICKGWHPLMETVKKFDVPNEYLYKKMLAEYPSINRDNVNLICTYLCKHTDKMQVFDYTSTVQMTYQTHVLLQNDAQMRVRKFPPMSRITFNMEEQRRGAKSAYEMGILNSYVCFFARDNAYVKQSHRNMPQSSFDNADKMRNSDINDFALMAEELEKVGLQSVRMGSVVDKAYTGPGVDYSNAGRSDFMDIYLFAHCQFCVLYDSGIYHIPVSLFSKPCIAISPAYAVAYYGDGHVMPELIVYYLTYSGDKKGLLTLKEQLELNKSLGYYVYNYYPYYLEHDLHSVPASPEDLRDAALEMVNILNGTQRYTQEDNELIQKFHTIINEYTPAGSGVGGALGRPAIAWLRKNRWFLA